MKRIALLGDIHSNLPALEAVLRHAHEQGVDELWNTGDFVGYGAFPDEVVGLLREVGERQVIGNYDRKVLKVKRKKEKWSRSKQPLKLMAFEWTNDQLSDASLAFLHGLPKQLRFVATGYRVLLTHGSPSSIKEPISPSTSKDRLQELAALSECDLIITGHSHQQLAVQVSGVWFMNPGSVGRPDDGDPRACYAILDLTTTQLAIEHYRVEYDILRAAEAIRSAGLPERFAQMVLQGRSLDAIEFEAE
jgi:putative phosphoesterase